MLGDFGTRVFSHLAYGVQQEENEYRQQHEEIHGSLLSEALEEPGLEEPLPSLRGGHRQNQKQDYRDFGVEEGGYQGPL